MPLKDLQLTPKESLSLLEPLFQAHDMSNWTRDCFLTWYKTRPSLSRLLNSLDYFVFEISYPKESTYPTNSHINLKPITSIFQKDLSKSYFIILKI